MHIKNIIPSFLIALFLVLNTTVLAATNQEYFIENVEQVTFSKNTLASSDINTKHLSFSSFKKKFELVLKEKRQLMNGFSSKHENIKLYAGKIQGNDNSWARITVVNDEYTGAIFDGTELYMLDTGKNINGALKDANMVGVKTVIYKSSELSSHLNCGDHGTHSHDSAFSYKNLLSSSARQQFSPNLRSVATDSDINADFEVAEATASQQINLRIVADTEYAASSNLDAEAQVISQMNIVDGIFSEQVGVQFGITEIEVLTNNGSLSSTSPSELLEQFRTFIDNDNPGLAHLFTGRNLDGSTVGIATVGSICNIAGAGLTEAGGRGTMGALTAAHEFGHNFGSPHDNQAGSICESTPGNFLMNPSLNGSDQFSQCSLEQIANTLLGAQCLVPVDTAPAEPAASCDFSLDFANGDNDFNFVSDPQSPIYSSGSTFGGNLNTLLGGVDDVDIADIEGVWSRQCISDSDSNMTFNIEASLSQSPEYEASEFSQIALRVNGITTVLDTITGDGNGGPELSTGIQQYSVNVPLDSGVNTVELICFNNLKTLADETTECRFSSLETSAASEEICFPIKTNDSEFVTICL